MSRFYKSNTFVLSKNINLHDPFGSFMNILTSVWLGNIGQQTSLIRNLVIDLDALCPVGCRGSWGFMSMEDSCFKSQDGLIEVQDLLRAIWNHNMDVVVTFIQPQSQAFQDMRHSASEYSHTNLALQCFVCNAAIITKVFESLMKDQLGLQKYGRLLGGVGIKRDGSGGSVTWTASHQHDKDYGHSCGARVSGLSSCLEFQEDFIAEHGGTRLRMQNRPKASLMSLPSKLQHRIFAKNIVPTEPIDIDFGRDTGFQQGLLHVHRDIYIRYWHTFIRECEFHVRIRSSEPTTSFSDFKPLQNLLRKHLNARSLFSVEVMPQIFHDGGMHLFAATRRPGRVNIEMNFQLTSSMQLRDLCIDILPFVMATSSLHGDRKVTISIANPVAAGDSNFHGSQDIRFEDLRSKVYQALVEIMPTHAHVVDRVCPKIWINGLGDVVATDLADGPLPGNCGIIAEPPDFLIDMLKDIGWRDYRCKICQPEDFGCLYPYNNSAASVLRYLRLVLQYHADGSMPPRSV
jgi:hypothetical protein